MTDDLVKRLDDLDTILETEFDTQLSVQRNPYGATKAIEDALYLLRDQAARLEALTSEREAFEQDNHRWKMECENFWRDRERILTAERDRAEDELYELQQTCITLRGENEALTAERDRLRKELEAIANDYEAGYPLSHDAIKYAARAALKGESDD